MKAGLRVAAIVVIALVAAVVYSTVDPLDAHPQQGDMPRFAPDGSLMRPDNWEEWVMVGASIGLTYSESGPAPVPGAGPGMIHTVFMQPWAYRHYRKTGEFAENTMFILALAQASQTADPARGGFYETDRTLAEIHLKRSGLHRSGWGFYAFGAEAGTAPMIPGEASCYSCHAEHTTFDNVFVQFYPPLRRTQGGE